MYAESFINGRMHALERKGMKVNLGKTKMMVSGSKGEISKSKIDPCGICGKRIIEKLYDVH